MEKLPPQAIITLTIVVLSWITAFLDFWVKSRGNWLLKVSLIVMFVGLCVFLVSW
jgi:hypothetical protein